jgi:hypothetical protein
VAEPEAQASSESQGIALAFAILGAGPEAIAALAREESARCQALGWSRRRASAVPMRWACGHAQTAGALPAGLARLHPSFIAAALAGEPSDVIAGLRSLLPTNFAQLLPAGRPSGARRVARAFAPDLARVAFAHLSKLWESDCGPLAERLCALTFADLEREVMGTGARVLGHGLARTDASVRARSLAAVGEPWAAMMSAAFTDSLSEVERKHAIACAVANVNLALRTPGERLAHLGLASLKVALAGEHPGSLLRVAGRLGLPWARQLVDSL